MHLNTLTIDVEIEKIIYELQNNKKKKVDFIRNGSKCKVILKTKEPICCSTFGEYKHLATFTLRDEYMTLAIGKITKIQQF